MSHVLLVDDDAGYTFALTALLQGGGHQVSVAHRADEAISTARAQTFDVAFLDLRLPDSDGLSVLDEIIAVDPWLPVICLTGLIDPPTVVQAMRKGAVDYLTKPADRQTLLSAVASASQYAASRRAGALLNSGGLSAVVGESPQWKRSMELIVAAAAAPRTTVLITGEPGVGKEVAANLLHQLSKRAGAPMVSANAACFPASLMESELFGHEVGSFTGASKRRKGLFEQADGGVLFLDEIGELPLDLQSKLLRVLEGHPFRRLGGEEPVEVDTRLVAATNRDLLALIDQGRFRADLYARLRVFEIRVPPLRERRDDIVHLALHFFAKLGRELGTGTPNVGPAVLDLLSRHDWPGNVRELRNVIERALVLAAGAPIGPGHLPLELRATEALVTPARSLPEPALSLSLEEVTKRHIVAVFNDCGGNLTHAADRLGMSRLALRKRLQLYGLKPVRP
ncbi:MAG: sigma-54 dependent transcriptional regulator [Myxococcaceae bacterium]